MVASVTNMFLVSVLEFVRVSSRNHVLPHENKIKKRCGDALAVRFTSPSQENILPTR